jgi:DNA-binding MarR family transcriptional regulator
MSSLDEEIGQYEAIMERLVSAYRARMTEICKAADLTPPQFWALYAIADTQRIKMSPLADCLGLSMGAASTLIDRLVGRGLVQRESDPQDRRAVFVSLTDKGNRVLEEAQASRRDLNQQAFKHMAPEVRQQLVSGLQAMVSTWESLGVPSRSCKSAG